MLCINLALACLCPRDQVFLSTAHHLATWLGPIAMCRELTRPGAIIFLPAGRVLVRAAVKQSIWPRHL